MILEFSLSVDTFLFEPSGPILDSDWLIQTISSLIVNHPSNISFESIFHVDFKITILIGIHPRNF